MKKILLLFCGLLVFGLAAAEDSAEEPLYAKVTVPDADLYRQPDTTSGTLCSPYRYGEIVGPVQIEDGTWVSIPFGSDRRGYMLARCLSRLTDEELERHLAAVAAEQAEIEAAAATVDEPEHKVVYPFFNGVKAGRNAIWFVVAALILLVIQTGRVHFRKKAGSDREKDWRNVGWILAVTVLIELWYFCSLGFSETLWFLIERQTNHDEWFLLFFILISALQGLITLRYLCAASGTSDLESAGFSWRRLVVGVILAAALYGLFAIAGRYPVSEAFTCVLCVVVGFLPLLIPIFRRVPLPAAAISGLALVATVIMVAASLVIILMLIICLIVMVVAVIVTFKGATHAVTHMYDEESTLKHDLERARKDLNEGRIDSGEYCVIEKDILSRLNNKKN